MSKRIKGIIMKIVLCLILLASFMGACTCVNRKLGLDDDNPIEEAIEELIEHKTGLDIDLTPEKD